MQLDISKAGDPATENITQIFGKHLGVVLNAFLFNRKLRPNGRINSQIAKQFDKSVEDTFYLGRYGYGSVRSVEGTGTERIVRSPL